MPTIQERPATDEYAASHQAYIARVPDGDVVEILSRQLERTRALLAPLPPERARHRYAPGKWSVVEVVGHVCDSERIFAYRALRIARGDATPLPGFDENTYVPAGRFDARRIEDVLAELESVRAATLTLLRTFDADAWKRRGTANQASVSARGLAYVIAGHELHHTGLLRERYGVEEKSGARGRSGSKR